jgi:hypothetical protein
MSETSDTVTADITRVVGWLLDAYKQRIIAGSSTPPARGTLICNYCKQDTVPIGARCLTCHTLMTMEGQLTWFLSWLQEYLELHLSE